MTVGAGPYQIVGYPMQLSHKKYHRNALLFNVAFVFPRDSRLMTDKVRAAGISAAQVAATQLRPYHPVIRKLATVLESLELESEFLFRRADAASKRSLQNVISRIFRSLNAYGECSVSVDVAKVVASATSAGSGAVGGGAHAAAAVMDSKEQRLSKHGLDASLHEDPANKIHLKLYPLLALPPKHIPTYVVPLRVKDLDVRWKVEWDLTLRQVLPFMDGVNYVERISILSGVHIALVAKCVRQMLYYEAVQLVDIFQFSNVYTPCEKLRTAAATTAAPHADDNERARVAKLRADARRTCRFDPTRPKPPFSVLFRLWCGLHAGVCLADFFRTLPTLLLDHTAPTLESLNIHPRKFVQFALINGFIRRVHAYPVLISAFAAATTPTTASGVPASPAYTPAHGDATFVGLIHGRSGAVDEALSRSVSTLKLRASASSAKLSHVSSSTTPLVDDRDDRSAPQTPLPMPTPPASAAYPSGAAASTTSFRLIERYLDGEHHFDQLSVLLQRSYKQLDDEIRRSRRCVVIHK